MKKYKWFVIAVCTISLISGCGKSTEKQISEQLEAGNKYLIEGNYEAAVVAFNKVIEIDPKIFEAYKKCAESYKEMNDFQNAIAVMENGIDVIGEDNLSEEDIILVFGRNCIIPGKNGKRNKKMTALYW